MRFFALGRVPRELKSRPVLRIATFFQLAETFFSTPGKSP
jgi:hypothetical protein